MDNPNTTNTTKPLKSKQELIDKFNDATNSNVHHTDVKYVIINFNNITWCKFEPLECIFAEEDTFEEFNIKLIEIIKKKYPIEAKYITDIQYSKNKINNKPVHKYFGKVFDKVEDNDILFIAWFQITEWTVAC